MSSDPLRFGTLRLTLPGGERREFAMDQPWVTIGRASDNVLIVEDNSLARRHARLSVDTGRLFVEDLGSATGTFLGGQRLAPNAPTLLSEGQVLQLGDVRFEYDAPGAVDAASAFSMPAEPAGPVVDPSPAGQTINAALIPPAQPVAPGNTATATLTLQNRSVVVDELSVSVAGLPADWVHISQPRVPLLPNAQQIVTILFQPPRSASASAGEHAYTITVSSAENGSAAIVGGTIRLLPFNALAARLEPIRARRDFTLYVDNQGNTPISIALTGTDDEKALDFRFSAQAFVLPPGQGQAVTLRVIPLVRPALTAHATHSFGVAATPTERSIPPMQVAGQLMIRPAIPGWLLPLVLLLSACLCLTGGGYAYYTYCPTYAPDMPLCPATALPDMTEPTSSPAIAAATPPPNATAIQTTQPSPTEAPPRATTVPTRTPPPTPNPALGTFETNFDPATELVYPSFGPTFGDEAMCAFHPLTLGQQDVGKTLTVFVLDMYLPEGLQEEQPDWNFYPDVALYRSYTGRWVAGDPIDFWDRPTAEVVVAAEPEISWTVSREGDYHVCLQVPINTYDAYPFAYSYARYSVILSGN